MSGFSDQVLVSTEEKKISPKELFLKYLSYVIWFVLSLVICLLIAYAYVRYSQPIYLATAKVLIKEDGQSSGSARGGQTDLLDAAVLGGKKVNIDNEIELIHSKVLIARVVRRYDLNTQYYQQGKIVHSNVYDENPFKLVLNTSADSVSNLSIKLSGLNSTGGMYAVMTGSNTFTKAQMFTWGKAIHYKNRYFLFSRTKEPLNYSTYIVSWQPVASAANSIADNLKVTAFSKNTTIILLKFETDNIKRGTVVLDGLIDEYKQLNVEEKNKIALNTINFINQRLELITSELSGVENKLEGFRNQKGVIAPSAQIVDLYKDVSDQEKQLIELNIKKKLGDFLLKEIVQSKTPGKTVPSNLGIDDPVIGALVARYNEIQIKLDRETPLNAPGSLVITDLKDQLESNRKSLASALQNYQLTLKAQISDIESITKHTNNTLNQVPSTERVMKEISRQQTIKEGLYLYLLQKREETEITYSATVSNFKQIDFAEVSSNPIAPNRTKALLIALVVGLLIPAGVIFIIEFFNDKVVSREDITKRTKAPFMGEVGHIDDAKVLLVNNNSRSIISEQFRLIRTNLHFLLQDRKTILVTSSISGEGKSFISLNVAAVLAISGKKVALLEFDLRKPRILSSLNLPKSDVGLSNYLVGQNVDLEQIQLTLPEYPTLHIYNSGPIPPNPAELMLGDRMTQLFTELKAKYDYVIVDSAPVGLVGDSFTIADQTDAVLYIIRQRYTVKTQVDFINDIYLSKKLNNMGLVVNDVKIGARFGYYGYGNSYGYGYTEKNSYFENKKETWLTRIKRLF